MKTFWEQYRQGVREKLNTERTVYDDCQERDSVNEKEGGSTDKTSKGCTLEEDTPPSEKRSGLQRG